ncbi:MAG TPA: hypothetical protein PK991_08040 [Candidatus Sabulitectum sp.]|nr:hypothetical protein [Candidatus Sabulitectum sp.]
MAEKKKQRYRTFLAGKGIQLSDVELERVIQFLQTLYGLIEDRLTREHTAVNRLAEELNRQLEHYGHELRFSVTDQVEDTQDDGGGEISSGE